MKAVVITAPGGAEVLQPADLPDPVPGPGEVVLDVVAAGVNRADLLQRQGHYPPPPGAPEWPGLEASGVVRAVGPDVPRWAVGDRVCALLAGGGYAEQVAVPWQQLLPVPDGVSLVHAAALPEVACTVWNNVVQVGGLQAGQTLLVHGGGSGIGTMAVQVGAALGARVLVTAGSQQKIDVCVGLGAAAGINYRTEDFAARVKDLTDGRGADVVLDVVGAKYLGANVKALARGGRIVVIGLQGGVKGELPLGLLLAKGGSLHATSLRARPLDEKQAIVADVEARLWPLVAAGTVRPVVDRVMPLADAGAAHEVLQRSEHVGKVLLATGAQG